MKSTLKSTKGKTNKMLLLSPMVLCRPERARPALRTVKFTMPVDSARKEQKKQGEDSVLLGVALHGEDPNSK